jgi:hypothetical protein
MAAAVQIGSTPEQQIAEFQAHRRKLLEVSKNRSLLVCDRDMGDGRALNHILREAIDGGQLLRADLWHPQRAPVFHSAETVRRLHRELVDALNRAIQENGPPPANDWYGPRINDVIALFAHAVARSEATVSFLEPPQDEERARRVLIPIQESAQHSSPKLK